MCECYKIGGPWIAEDPDCPIHGTAAQRVQEDQEGLNTDLQEQIFQLASELNKVLLRIHDLERSVYLSHKGLK